jgi:hypothetical protein
VDEEPDNQHLLDRQLLGSWLSNPDQLVGQLSNQVIDDVADQPVSPLVDRPVDELGHRPVRPRKRKQVAIESTDEPVRMRVRAVSLRHKRQKRTD